MRKVPTSNCSSRLASILAAIVAIFAVTFTPCAVAHTAILFGATGAVGSQVLWALLNERLTSLGDKDQTALFWSNLILVSRRKAIVDHDVNTSNSSNIKVTQVIIPDLTQVHKNEELLSETSADACFIAVGAGYPQDGTLREWHAVDYVMADSISRLCKSMNVQYISLLSAVDSASNPEPFSEAELGDDQNTVAIGWWKMLVNYARMKGLAEQVVESSGIPHVSLMQPSNIVTDVTRYGWLDKTLFWILPYIDLLLPSKYHSVKVRLLGMAMVGDAENAIHAKGNGKNVVRRLHYDDFIHIAGERYEKYLQGNRFTHVVGEAFGGAEEL